jgi:hypothetical protein
MKWYQVYFFFLKTIVLIQLGLVFLNVDFAHNPIFLLADTLFKVSLGLFMGIYFWLFTPKGLDWEDGFIISIGGFLILAEIKFGPIIAMYEKRDEFMKQAQTWLGLR